MSYNIRVDLSYQTNEDIMRKYMEEKLLFSPVYQSIQPRNRPKKISSLHMKYLIELLKRCYSYE